jgi:hypothetical protein
VAKKKSRVPTPPKGKRNVQAPKAYHAPRDPRRTRILFIALGAAIVVAAAAVGIAMAVAGGDEGGSEAAGPCERQTFEALGRGHVEELNEGFEYNSTPATSGPHHPQTLIWNIYDRPVPEINAVHNLEHGGVVVQYGEEVPQATVDEIAEWYSDDPRGLIVAPHEELGNEITLTAWTHLMTCSDFDEETFDDFVGDYRGPDGDAPEKFPLDALQPGSA